MLNYVKPEKNYLPDPIIRQTGPGANGLGARLMAQEPECQVKAKPLAAVAIVRDAHDTSCVLRVTTTVLGKNSQNTTTTNLVIFDQIQ
jgi:hypothetical protein